MNWRRFLRSYDVFAKTMEDVTTRTLSGGLITVLSVATVLVLIAMQFIGFLTTEWRSELVVDTSSRKEQMTIHFNITYPHIPCFVVTLDIMDAASEHQTNIQRSLKKVRLDAGGQEIDEHVRNDMKPKTDLVQLDPKSTADNTTRECGSCYAATSLNLFGGLNCCNTCEEVQEAYKTAGIELPSDLSMFEQCHREDWTSMIRQQRYEGCRLSGFIKVNKIPGNFHFAPGYSFNLNGMHAHDLRPFPKDMTFDFSHTIHYLTFGGNEDDPSSMSTDLSSNNALLTNPLQDHSEKFANEQMYSYFLKVVPTTFHYRNGNTFATNQYSASSHHRDAKDGGALTGAYFNLEISPLMINYHEASPSFASFLTSCCAIIGGVYTIATLFDSLIYSAEKRFLHKQSLGKVT